MKKPWQHGLGKERADHAVLFVRQLCHTKGEWRGIKFNLLPWQEALLRQLFGTLTPEGVRQYRWCYLEVPKKNGKSELAAAIALLLLCADWEPGAEIYSAAASRQQAAIVADIAITMVRFSPGLSSVLRPFDGRKRIVYPATGSFYQAVSADVGTKHGVNAHGVIVDEVHVQPNRRLWDALTVGSGAARRQQLVVGITTAGSDKASLCGELHDYAVAVAKKPELDPTFLPMIYGLDEHEDWRKESNWRRANPSLGEKSRGRIIDIKEIRREFKKARQMPSLENAFRRLRLNQWMSQHTRYIPMDRWDACSQESTLGDLAGQRCFAGLDLASSIAMSAYVLVFPPAKGETLFRVVSWFWIPRENMRDRMERDRAPYDMWVRAKLVEATPGDVIDYGAVKHRILATRKLFRVRELAYDPWGASQLVQELQDEGMTVVPFGQTMARMSPPTKELLTLVMTGQLDHGGNPVLRWMADNFVVKQDPAGNVRPDRHASTGRIDGMIGMLMGLDRSLRHEGGKSVYTTRPMRVISVGEAAEGSTEEDEGG